VLKAAAVIGSILVVLVAAFVVVPKLLLKVSSDSSPSANRNLPVGAAHSSSATPSTGVDAQVRRFDSFSSLATQAGFTPLTPSGLPNGYLPFEQYTRTGRGGMPNEIVLTYRKAPDLYVLVDERPGSPPAVPGQGQGRQFGGATPAVARGQNGASRSPRVDINGSPGFYFGGRFGPAGRAFGPSTDLDYHNTQPQAVQFFRQNLEIVIEADLTDVSRDQLLQIAGGLR
jgi:hypothetical protein